jgi:hypothetical protein
MRSGLTAPVLAEIGKRLVKVALLVELEFDTATARFWSGVGDLVWMGETFTGAGRLGRGGPIGETTEIRAVGRTLGLSGIDAATVALAAQAQYQNRPARTWLAFFDDAGAIIPDPLLLTSDRMDNMVTTDQGATATLDLTVESKLVDLLSGSERRITAEDQKIDYPDDEAFQYVAGLENKEVFWGVGGGFRLFGPVGPPPTLSEGRS